MDRRSKRHPDHPVKALAMHFNPPLIPFVDPRVSSWRYALSPSDAGHATYPKQQSYGAAVSLHRGANACPTCWPQNKATEELTCGANWKRTIAQGDGDAAHPDRRQIEVRKPPALVAYRERAGLAIQRGQVSPAGLGSALGSAP